MDTTKPTLAERIINAKSAGADLANITYNMIADAKSNAISSPDYIGVKAKSLKRGLMLEYLIDIRRHHHELKLTRMRWYPAPAERWMFALLFNAPYRHAHWRDNDGVKFHYFLAWDDAPTVLEE